ncbi:hypothetical protein BS78_01G087200 [Paspalum vaginatum]|nr:hypothetical protein BS78_01G087200 [Paspalum vaginatum]
MLARIIFCVAIAAAVLAVVLLATVSPLPHRSGAGRKGAPGDRRTFAFAVYVHPAAVSTAVRQEQVRDGEASALVFHHRVTVGPESTSRTVGAASGFVLPGAGRGAAAAVFDTVHLEFDGDAGLAGSLCVEAGNAKAAGAGRRWHDGKEEEEVLRVVGGTGAFAFARGHAVLRGHRHRPGATATAAALLLELSISYGGS